MKSKNTIIFVICFLILMEVLSGCTSDTKTREEENKVEIHSSEEEDVKILQKQPKKLEASKLFQNKNARYAFAMAVDKDYLQQVVMNNGSTPADYLISKGLSVEEDGADFRDKYPNGFLGYNLPKASEYWDLAKKELDFDVVELSLLCYDIDDYRSIANFLKFEFEKNLKGVKINIIPMSMIKKIDKYKKREFDIDLASWTPDYSDPMTFLDLWTSDSPYNPTGFSKKEYDHQIYAAKFGTLALEPDERIEVLQELEKDFLEEAYLIPLFQSGRLWLQRDYVEDLVINSSAPELIMKYADVRDAPDKRKISFGMYSEITSLDSAMITEGHTASIVGNVFEGLMSVGRETNTLENALAESYTISEDQKVYTFHLRKDARWSNGDIVDAYDFVYAWKRIVNPEFEGSSYIFETAGILNAHKIIDGELPVDELGVKALDRFTLEVRLEVPIPYFLKLMTFPIFFPVNAEFVEEVGNNYGTGIDNTVFNGPYVLNSWVRGKGYRLKKNKKYWDFKSVKMDEIEFNLVKNMQHGIDLYESGAIDLFKIGREYGSVYSDSHELKHDLLGTMTYFTLNGSGKYER